jgi:hypothetical protein
MSRLRVRAPELERRHQMRRIMTSAALAARGQKACISPHACIQQASRRRALSRIAPCDSARQA